MKDRDMGNTVKRYWDIAGITICVSGYKEIVEQFGLQLLGCELEMEPRITDLRIRIVESTEECGFVPQYFSLSGSVRFNANSFSKKTNKYIYIIKNLFSQDDPTEVTIIDKENVGIMEGINRAKYGKVEAYWKCKSYMNYSFFWMVLALVLQKKNKVFLHSSIAIINGQAIVFCGTGGCGKTSTLFEMLEKEEALYLAEDFGIIDQNGLAYFNPKTVTMYASDVKYGQKDLVSYIERMSGRDNIIWKIDCALGKNPRRKINPKELLGATRIGNSAKVGLVVFLIREERNDTVCEELNKEDLIYRMTEATYRELKELFEILSNINALGGKSIPYPSIEELKLKHSEILRDAINNAKGCLCRVNRKNGPDEILRAIWKWSDKNNFI